MLSTSDVGAFAPTVIEDTVRGLAERGVSFLVIEGLGQDDLRIWKTPGTARVAWFRDPDGNTPSLSQHG